MHHQPKGTFGKHLLGIELHVDRQGGLQWGVTITARGKCLVAPNGHQADSEIPHRTLQQSHAGKPQIPRRHVAQNDFIETLKFRQGSRQRPLIDHLNLQLRPPQGGR